MRLFDYFLAGVRSRRDRETKRFNGAVAAFRSTIFFELEGIYPITRFWDKELFPRFSQSIPKIDRAAAEFRYFVKSKTNFDTAINVRV